MRDAVARTDVLTLRSQLLWGQICDFSSFFAPVGRWPRAAAQPAIGGFQAVQSVWVPERCWAWLRHLPLWSARRPVRLPARAMSTSAIPSGTDRATLKITVKQDPMGLARLRGAGPFVLT